MEALAHTGSMELQGEEWRSVPCMENAVSDKLEKIDKALRYLSQTKHALAFLGLERMEETDSLLLVIHALVWADRERIIKESR